MDPRPNDAAEQTSMRAVRSSVPANELDVNYDGAKVMQGGTKARLLEIALRILSLLLPLTRQTDG